MPGREEQFKAISLESMRGIATQILSRLNRLGLDSYYDLMMNLPFRYEDRTYVSSVRECAARCAHENNPCNMILQLLSGPTLRGKSASFRCIDLTGEPCILVFFNLYPRQLEHLTEGLPLLVFGTASFDAYTKSCKIMHPEYRVLDDASLELPTSLTPVYHLTSGLYQHQLRRFTETALEFLCGHPLDELLPRSCNPFEMTLNEALLMVHNPAPDPQHNKVRPHELDAFKRLCFEELLAYRLSILHLKSLQQSRPAQPVAYNRQLQTDFAASLPFEPTSAQIRVFEEIMGDMQTTSAMNRLVQGDVGSGKTLVAAMAILQCAKAGGQAVMLAPTDLLAKQHHQKLSFMFESFGLKTVLLIGSLRKKERSRVLKACADGTADVIVGTHAVFQEGVTYKNLALAVFDEQHRFGVNQREALLEKAPENLAAHELLMTATPIPRSMQMTLYKDTAVSAVNELPKGRIPIKTAVIAASRCSEVVARLREYCKGGEQVYWICTLVEENEQQDLVSVKKREQSLSEALPEFRVGLLHGQMPERTKSDTMERFANGEINILVATTVVEVGVDVPNATVIIIENAERLGLAQLHQLRGRVGRGNKPSFCILLYKDDPHYENRAVSMTRLQIMKQTQDGFEIANRDLELRGPGEYFGTNQTGRERFRYADPVRDRDITALSAQIAEALFKHDPKRSAALIERWFPEVNMKDQ